jgi:hypothetical protein
MAAHAPAPSDMNATLRTHAHRLIAPFALVALAIALYWPSTSLPLSFDDAWSVRLVRHFSLPDLFTQTQNFGYYRPLYLAYYRLAAAAGAHGPLLLHILCIAGHAANALLLLKLAPAMLGRRSDAAAPGAVVFGAACLFALNPFAVQAVALPAGLNHLLALLFIQAAMLCYARARLPAAGRGRWWLACLSLSLLAFLSNEIGLCVAGFAFAYELMHALRTRRWTRRSWSFLTVTALAGAYALAYQLIPKGASPEFVFTIGDALRRALIALQTLAYPLALALGPLGLPAEASVLAATALMLSLCAWAMRGPQRGAVALGLLLFAAGAALPALRLPTGYVENAPRVFYVATLGTAIAWSALAWALTGWLAPRAQAVAAGAAIAAIGLAGAWHVRDHQAFLARANEPVQAIAEAGAALAPGEQVLALNAPEWVAAPARRFPMFSEGAIVLAPYVEGSDLVLANTGLERTVHLAQYPLPGDPARPYSFRTFGQPLDPAQLAGATRILQTQYLPEALRTDWLGGATTHGPATAEVAFAGGPSLAQHHIQACRQGWVVALQWRRPPAPAGEFPPTLSAFVQALDANGAKLAQSDGAPLNGLLPFASLPADRDIVDRRVLLAPDAAGAMLHLGVYDYVTGERLPATDAQGRRLAGDALTLPLPPLDPGVACR